MPDNVKQMLEARIKSQMNGGPVTPLGSLPKSSQGPTSGISTNAQKSAP
jgi:hypothetical protein